MSELNFNAKNIEKDIKILKVHLSIKGLNCLKIIKKIMLRISDLTIF